MDKLKENSETNVENAENKGVVKKLHKAFKIPFMVCMFLYIASLFTVFFTPIDILDTNKNCADFVNIMEQIFSNIKIFGSVSKIPQIIKFHASVVWVFAMIVCLAILMYMIVVQYKARLYLEEDKLLSAGAIIFGALFWCWGMWIYWSGYIATHTFIRMMTITMSSKIEIFLSVTIFQSAFIASFLGLTTSITDFYIIYKRIK